MELLAPLIFREDNFDLLENGKEMDAVICGVLYCGEVLCDRLKVSS